MTPFYGAEKSPPLFPHQMKPPGGILIFSNLSCAKLRVGWPNHGQLLAYILQRGVLSKHLRIFQTMILAKQYCHERWNSSVCHWSQTCLYLRFLQLPNYSSSYIQISNLSYLYIHYNALACKQHDPMSPHISVPTILGTPNGRLWQLLRPIKVGPVASPASWIEHWGISTIPGKFSTFWTPNFMEVCFKPMTFPCSSWGDF